MSVTVERAASGQSADIASILIEAAQWLAATGRPMWRVEGFDPGRIRSDVESGRYLLASVDGEPAGTVRFEPSDQEFWPDVPDGETIFLHRLAIRRRFARHGVSDAMIKFSAEETVRLGRRFLRLDCVVDRMPLRAFYERHDFRYHSDYVAGEWHVARYEMAVAAVESLGRRRP